MSDEQLRPTITNLADLMPKFDPGAVEGLRRNMAAIGLSMAQYGEGLRKAAPTILANVAKALPALPSARTSEEHK
ncbi:hypothetical protein ACFWIW_10775 [Amycolatopsis sp. NPDC058340]|uniref:hypothetical protein n=1 Tax=Amycolatopsis sp. NPDC058340 TaxID=3346453 RepID=UPI0036569639